MSNPARTQEFKIGIGFKKQTGTGLITTTKTQVQTPLAAPSLWSLHLGSYNVPFPQLNEEDDGPFFGKGDEWVTQLFPTSIDMPWEWPFHLTSQNWAQVIAFALHNITPSTPAAGAFQYICSPMIPPLHGVNLPCTTLIADVRAGTAGEIIDQALVGVVCAGFTLRIKRGPGLQNTELTSRWVGCGKFVENSGIAVPEIFSEVRLGAGSSTSLLINGVDYLANERIVEVEFTYENNPALEGGYFPGSGQQSNRDLRGRMRYGTRTMSMMFTAELENGSSELTQILNGVEGSTILQVDGPIISGAVPHRAKIELPRTRLQNIETVEADGFTAARCKVAVMKHPSLGPAIFTAITDKADIGIAA